MSHNTHPGTRRCAFAPAAKSVISITIARYLIRNGRVPRSWKDVRDFTDGVWQKAHSGEWKGESPEFPAVAELS